MRNTFLVGCLLVAGVCPTGSAQPAALLQPGVYTLCGRPVPQLRVTYHDGAWWFSSRLGTNLPWVGPYRGTPVDAETMAELDKLPWTQRKILWAMRWSNDVVIGMTLDWRMRSRIPNAPPLRPDVLLRSNGGILGFCLRAKAPQSADES